MDQPTRKRQHQQSPPAVKEEHQEQEKEGTTHSNDAGINGNASQCSSSNFADSNTIGTAAAAGNGGDDINQLKLKMDTLETRNHLLEGKLEYQELHARIRETNFKQENTALWTKLKEVEENAKTDCKKMMDEFGKRLTALEAKHQQEIAGLKAINERNQQQPTPTMSMNMQQGTSNNSNELQYIPSIMVPCHSANLPDRVNMQESHSHGYGLRPLESRHRQKTTLAAVAALISPPPPAPAVNPVPCHSVQQQEEGEVLDEEEAKRLCNPEENIWNQNNCRATMKVSLPDQLIVHNSSPKWGSIVAQKGFLVLLCRQLQQNHFAGPILYYYEIKIMSSKHNEGRLCLGLSHGTVPKGSLIGRIPNTYAIHDDKHDYCLLSGNCQLFEWPAAAIKPKWYGCGDVFGCGLVLSADNKLAIFFAINGILMGKQFPIAPAGSNLFPCVQLNLNVTVEANFGQKPFKYNIDQCPGLVFQW